MIWMWIFEGRANKIKRFDARDLKFLAILPEKNYFAQQGVDPESLMFRDGRRKIDMVLSYEEENEGVMTEQESKRREFRKTFLENLVKEGLELELEDKSQTYDEKTFFVKVHMPWKTETRYSEVLNLKLPIKRFITISVRAWVKYLIALCCL